MIKIRPYSATILALGGFILVSMGIYFVFLRPPLLPEDIRYMDSTSTSIGQSLPKLWVWLQKVFWVMGGFIFTTGLLTIFIAFTTFRTRRKGALSIAAITGISSIGIMTMVNFLIGSDFRIILLTFTIPWILACILYRLHK